MDAMRLEIVMTSDLLAVSRVCDVLRVQGVDVARLTVVFGSDDAKLTIAMDDAGPERRNHIISRLRTLYCVHAVDSPLPEPYAPAVVAHLNP